MKKIRRMRIRTETSKLIVIQNPAGQFDGEVADFAETCPACGQQIIAPLNHAAALPACPDIHAESNHEGILESGNQEK